MTNDEDIKQSIIRGQQLKALTATTPIAMGANFLNSALAVYMFWGYVSPLFLTIWGGSVWGLCSYLLYRWFIHRGRSTYEQASAGIEKAAIVYGGFIGVMWALFILFTFRVENDQLASLSVFLCVGMIAGGVLSLISMPKAAYAYNIPLTCVALISVIVGDIEKWWFLIPLLFSFSMLVMLCARNFYAYLDEAVSRRLETEAQKKVIELLLNDFGNHASDWLWETNAGGQLTYSSRLALVGVDDNSSRVLGKTLVQVLEMIGTLVDKGALRSLMDEGKPFSKAEFKLVSATRNERWFSISANPKSKDGLFVGYRGVASDITEIKKASLEILHAKEQAEQVSREKSNFAAMVSHEFRTPLNAIIGYSEIMERKLFGSLENERYQEYVGFIANSGRRLKKIIEDVAVISRLNSPAAKVSRERINLVSIFKDMDKQYAPQAEEKGQEWQMYIAPDVSYVWGDFYALEQIITNLIDNSFKFSKAGNSIQLKADIGPKGFIKIQVIDTGVGMKPEMVARLKKPFEQAHDIHVEGGGGLGLGLAIVTELAIHMKADLNIETEQGVGTTVTLDMPEAL